MMSLLLCWLLLLHLLHWLFGCGLLGWLLYWLFLGSSLLCCLLDGLRCLHCFLGLRRCLLFLGSRFLLGSIFFLGGSFLCGHLSLSFSLLHLGFFFCGPLAFRCLGLFRLGLFSCQSLGCVKFEGPAGTSTFGLLQDSISNTLLQGFVDNRILFLHINPHRCKLLFNCCNR
ncbi:hypothetical protein HOLleu_25997 [Holothuria leucospilota]|uniref:Uncharacterized protein n=1 Tax=Holothuria leucospilota TaxID=206669 RepID=A0A9Q1BTG2_HOLLE|nr:hypothetical protein HOLleu_25997 [Holothuria leucospilota]